MRRADKARRIAEILDGLYPGPGIPLEHVDPYTLLIAVLLSAQCTDERVNKTAPALFARARTPAAMMSLSVREIEDIVRPCGLAPTKSKSIHGLSRILVERHDGEAPDDFEQREELTGLGHKTAGVVMSQAFGHAAFPIDTHIHRLAARWGLSDGSTVLRTERDLKAVFPPRSWARLHLQIIYFGREHCPALRHELDGCPICAWAASKTRKQAEAQRRPRRPGRRAAHA